MNRRSKTGNSVEVTASTLYEAVALGLMAFRGHEWVAGVPEGLAPVRVSVTSIPVEHAVKIRDFTNWVERKGGGPRELTDRDRVGSENQNQGSFAASKCQSFRQGQT